MGSKVEEMKMEDFIKIEKIGEGNKEVTTIFWVHFIFRFILTSYVSDGTMRTDDDWWWQLLTEHRVHSGEYWAKVVAVQTSKVHKKWLRANIQQYRLLGLDQARLISSLLYDTWAMNLLVWQNFDQEKTTQIYLMIVLPWLVIMDESKNTM